MESSAALRLRKGRRAPKRGVSQFQDRGKRQALARSSESWGDLPAAVRQRQEQRMSL